MQPLRPILLVGSLLLAQPIIGCQIEKHEHGKGDDVKIGTPFGSMQVQTDEAAALRGLGLTPYPGAKQVHKEGGNDGAANVNMSFGDFKLGVRAVELQTGDPTDKVVAFYRKDMGRYGAVITCRGHAAVGEPKRTAEGLACDSEKVQGSDDDELQLRAGSGLHQHIVGLQDRDGGTRIGLVALDLPGALKDHSSADSSRE